MLIALIDRGQPKAAISSKVPCLISALFSVPRDQNNRIFSILPLCDLFPSSQISPPASPMVMSSTITLIGFAASLLAIISSFFTLVTLSREWRRRTNFARDVAHVHRREVDVLKLVLKECSASIIGVKEVPESILETLELCEQRRDDLERVMTLATINSEHRWLSINFWLPLLEKDLRRRYMMFRDDVMLLRSLCAE
jgi:hypothetical protein